MSSLSENDVNQMCQVLYKDSTIFPNLKMIFRGLGLPDGTVSEEYSRLESKDSSNYDFYSRFINVWIQNTGKEATIEYFIEKLRKDRFNNAADQLVSIFDIDEARASHQMLVRKCSLNINPDISLPFTSSDFKDDADDFQIKWRYRESEDLWKRYESQLSKKSLKMVTISGCRSSGKSDLARRFAKKIRENQISCVWLSCKTKSMEKALHDFLYTFFDTPEGSIEGNGKTLEFYETLSKWLHNKKTSPWLLAFDHVAEDENVEFLKTLLQVPYQPYYPFILYTSRGLVSEKENNIHLVEHKQIANLLVKGKLKYDIGDVIENCFSNNNEEGKTVKWLEEGFSKIDLDNKNGDMSLEMLEAIFTFFILVAYFMDAEGFSKKSVMHEIWGGPSSSRKTPEQIVIFRKVVEYFSPKSKPAHTSNTTQSLDLKSIGKHSVGIRKFLKQGHVKKVYEELNYLPKADEISILQSSLETLVGCYGTSNETYFGIERNLSIFLSHVIKYDTLIESEKNTIFKLSRYCSTDTMEAIYNKFEDLFLDGDSLTVGIELGLADKILEGKGAETEFQKCLEIYKKHLQRSENRSTATIDEVIGFSRRVIESCEKQGKIEEAVTEGYKLIAYCKQKCGENAEITVRRKLEVAKLSEKRNRKVAIDLCQEIITGYVHKYDSIFKEAKVMLDQLKQQKENKITHSRV